MAINVTNVRNVSQGIGNISQCGLRASTDLNKVSETLRDFNRVWKGGLYESVANSYDRVVDDFNNLVIYLTVEVPNTINASMAHMASINQVSYVAANIQSPKPIEKVNAKKEEAMFMYEKASFDQKQNEIMSLLKDTKQQFRAILDEVNSGMFRSGFGENDSTYTAIKSSTGSMIQEVTTEIEGFESSFTNALNEISSREQSGEQASVQNINTIN